MNLKDGLSLYIDVATDPASELEWTASTYDRATGVDSRDVFRTTVAATGALELVPDPAAGVYRTMATAALHNPDASVTPEIHIFMDDGSFVTTQWKGTLAAKATLYYSHGVWSVYEPS